MSEGPAGTSRRRYTLVVLGLIAAGLVAAEWFIRDSVREETAMTPSQKFVLKVLTADNSDIVTGDSHVGSIDYHSPYTFIGHGGITPWELEQVLRTYFRGRPVGRVIIEVGPQQMAAKRQVEWRALANNSLVRQFAPFDIYLFEPELISIAEQRVAKWFRRSPDAEPAQPAAARKKPRADQAKRRAQEPYAAWSEELRLKRIPNHAARQRPVANFESSVAWQAQERLIRRLVAKGGKVCLVRTPLTREYEQWLAGVAEEWGYARHRRAVAALAKALHVPYIDYLDLGLGDLPIEDFRNPDHLNPRGQRIYWPAVDQACFPGTEGRP